MKKILIRADANSNIGIGHISRMIALGQLCQSSNFQVHFMTSTKSKYLLKSLNNNDFIIHNTLDIIGWNPHKDQEHLLNIAKKIKPSCIVLDGDHFGNSYEKKLRRKNID